MTIATSAEANSRKGWIPVALAASVLYPAIGIVFAALDKSSAAGPIHRWRLAAWLASAAVFAGHLAHEHFRLRSTRLRPAWHVSLSVAIGAFLLAVWINLQPRLGAASPRSVWAPLALILFPLVAGLPAFVVAVVVATALRWRHRGAA